MTPAAFQAAARALALGALWLVCLVLALCAILSLVQSMVQSFLGWRLGVRYRRAFAEAHAAAIDACYPAPAEPPIASAPDSFSRAGFVRPLGARPPLDS